MKHAHNSALAALAAALLASCGTVPDGEQGRAPAGEQSEPKPPEPAPKIVSLPYRVDVTYSPAARARLDETSARIGVMADYYGVPKSSGVENLDPELGVWLGGEMDVLKDGRTSLTLRGEVNAVVVARDVAGDARVRVTAFPVESPLAANAITCDSFDEALPIAVETGATIHCTLAGE